MAKIKDLIKNLMAVLIGIMVVTLLIEGSARIFASMLGVSPYMKYDEVVGWTAEPGITKHHKNPSFGFDVSYSINSSGFRGSPHEIRKPPGVYRIMILGDSNGFGWGISESKHFSAILANKLKNVQVINLSLSGYGTDQEYLRFTKEGIAYDPDLVIVQVTPNDFDEIQYPFYNQKPKPQFLVGKDGNLVLINVPVKSIGPKSKYFYDNSLPLPFKEWLGWNSYAFNILNEKYYMLKTKYARDSSSATEGRERFNSESITLFKKIISKLKVTLDEIGAKGLVVHSSKDISEKKLLEGSSLPIVDLHPIFSRSIQKTSVDPFFHDGYHWNVEGNRIVADELIDVIVKKYGVKPKTD